MHGSRFVFNCNALQNPERLELSSRVQPMHSYGIHAYAGRDLHLNAGLHDGAVQLSSCSLRVSYVRHHNLVHHRHAQASFLSGMPVVSFMPEEAVNLAKRLCKLCPWVSGDPSAACGVEGAQRGAIVPLQRINARIRNASDAVQGQQLQIGAALCQSQHCCVCELDAPCQVDVLQWAPLCHCCNRFICMHM